MDKPTEQSSTFRETVSNQQIIATSDKAVDGNSNTEFGDGYCSHTDIDTQPWWAVDLESDVTIFSVTITSRKPDCK